jgi:hypothetical protein
MSGHEFPVFPHPAEDARALLARLYREIGVSAVAAALDLGDAPEATLGGKARETLASLQGQSRRILAA